MLGYHHASLCAASGRCNTVVRLHQNCKRGTRMVVGNQRKPSMAIQSLDTNCKAAGTNSSCSGLKQHAEPTPIPPPQRNHAWILGLAIAVITASSGAVGTAADIPLAANDRSFCLQQQHSGQVTPDLHRNFGDLSNEVPRYVVQWAVVASRVEDFVCECVIYLYVSATSANEPTTTLRLLWLTVTHSHHL